MTYKEAVEKFQTVFVEGDFDVEGAECPYFCSPTCHPAQTGPKWKYGCSNEKHPRHDPRGFVPIVQCEGNLSKCELLSLRNNSVEGD